MKHDDYKVNGLRVVSDKFHTDVIDEINKLDVKAQKGNISISMADAEVVIVGGVNHYRKFVRIEYPSPFSSTPIPLCMAYTSAPYECFVAAQDLSSTGFTMVFVRKSKTNTGVGWIASV